MVIWLWLTISTLRSRVCMFFFFFCRFLFLSQKVKDALHGLPTSHQMVNRKEGADGGGTVDSPSLTTTGAAPQARGVIGNAPERRAVQVSAASSWQPAAVPVIWISAVWVGVRTLDGSDPILRRAQRLPAGRGSHWLTLCKETINFLFTSKLCKNSSVP